MVINNVIGSEGTLMHKAEQSSIYTYFSNSFTNYQIEKIQKGVICVQLLLEIYQAADSTV